MTGSASGATETIHAPQLKLPMINAFNANNATVEDRCQTHSCALMENESLEGDLLTAKISSLNTSQIDTIIMEEVNCMVEVTDSNQPTDLISILVEYVSNSTPPTSSKNPREAAHDLGKKIENWDISKISPIRKKIKRQL